MSQRKSKPGVAFDASAWQDYQYFKQYDKKLSTRIDELIKEALRSPLEGKGKPERLVGDFSGFYSRRIDREHRLVYTYANGYLVIAQCRFHY
ncbi:toxin YoeB [Arsukibacterium ikkense]|uniref:Putative mRNA interferase YoeB n=1 Tax=Arsukibacterium ikkense TaxID=336831 RepID=A0A0M2V431_9GAMM|nr:Txe/YoeB family addiction module toxin [Arsukibacterium ikkense]KKO43928.1 toxin YoeB [Arsukibacterium ikkense]